MISKKIKEDLGELIHTLHEVFKRGGADMERLSRQRKLNSSHLFYNRLLATSQELGLQTSTAHLNYQTDTYVSYQAVSKALQKYGSELANDLKDSLFRRQKEKITLPIMVEIYMQLMALVLI